MAVKSNYPAKRDVNLIQKLYGAGYFRNLIIAAVIIVAMITIFCKFCVIDRLAYANRLESEAAASEAQAEELRASTIVYEAILKEYQHYSPGRLDTGYTADEILDLIKKEILPAAQISSLNFDEYIVTLVLSDISLDKTSKLITTLKDNKMVSDASVSTANTYSESGVTEVSLTIVLNTAQEVEA